MGKFLNDEAYFIKFLCNLLLVKHYH